MELEQCVLCRGLRGHERIKDAMCVEFDKEYEAALLERRRLSELFNEVCWYNFETQCRSWNSPWMESLGASCVRLSAQQHTKRMRCGRLVEKSRYPPYYSGSVKNAPQVPPDVVLLELKAADEAVAYWAEQRFAPHEFAPGGRKYEELLRKGEGVRLFTQLCSNAKLK